MLPPAPIRRLLLVPLVVALAGALAALTPVAALLTVVVNLIRRRAGSGSRGRLLRVTWLGLVWSAGETAALAVSFCLWIASGFGGRLDTEPYQARHYAVLRRFLDLVYREASRACGLSVTVAGPDGPVPGGPVPGGTESAAGRPLIVVSRHAGPGDSLLLIHHLLSACGRRPRIVMKASLQFDPSLDVLANRLPNAFLRSVGTRGSEQVRRLAAGLGPGSALLIFPEGGNWTPLRWHRAIDGLRRGSRPDLAERAEAMRYLLPPHASGVLAAVRACPRADVVFVAHTGLDRMVGVRDVWRGLRCDLQVRARWWRVPAANVPRGASRDTQVAWLYDWWERLDAWIAAENPESPVPPESPGPPETELTGAP